MKCFHWYTCIVNCICSDVRATCNDGKSGGVDCKCKFPLKPKPGSLNDGSRCTMDVPALDIFQLTKSVFVKIKKPKVCMPL